MKRVFIILLGLMPFLGFSQNSIITNAGDTITGHIQYVTSSRIEFSDTIKSLNSNSIPLEDVSTIIGTLSHYNINLIQEMNPSVKFSSYNTERTSKYISAERGTYIPSYIKAGDLVKRSAYLRLSSLGVGVLTSTVIILGIDTWNTQDKNVISVVGGVLSLSLYIAGEVTLIKAGDKMNRDAVYLSMADNGLGIAIKF